MTTTKPNTSTTAHYKYSKHTIFIQDARPSAISFTYALIISRVVYTSSNGMNEKPFGRNNTKSRSISSSKAKKKQVVKHNKERNRRW